MRNESQNKVLKDIGSVLLYQRNKLKISRTKLALELGVDEKHIRRIENGEVNFTILSLLKICIILEIEISMFEKIKLEKSIIEF